MPKKRNSSNSPDSAPRLKKGPSIGQITALIVAVTGLIAAITALIQVFKPVSKAQEIPLNYQTNGPVQTNPIIVTNIPIDRIQTMTYEQDLPFFGGWNRSGGDANMDTDGNDRVPVRATTTLTNDSKRIWLEVKFSCAEDGGNRTTFSGTQKRILFEARGNRTIEALHVAGNNTVSFSATSTGRNHGWTPFSATQVNNSYWTRFGYRIDSPDSNDSRYVGVLGRISFRFDLK